MAKRLRQPFEFALALTGPACLQMRARRVACLLTRNMSKAGSPSTAILTPHCHGMSELPSAAEERARLSSSSAVITESDRRTPLSRHILHGLAYTTGSAIGSAPPSAEMCREAFEAPNSAGLTAGARAWSKHSHRSRKVDTLPHDVDSEVEGAEEKKKKKAEDESAGWWGRPSGPVVSINERALKLFNKVMENASWRNLHWLPHQVLVYEVRVPGGYGMRWSQNQSTAEEGEGPREWVFRGFLEPQMENGHEVGWRH